MSDLNTLIERLNKVMAWELAGTIQYLHHMTMVTGLWRVPYVEFFEEGSKEAREHAQLVADRIVALGGVPTVEPERVRVEMTLPKMLEAALALEEDALAAWESAYELAALANPGTQFWIEEMISHEQEHVDELKKILSGLKSAQATGADEARASS